VNSDNDRAELHDFASDMIGGLVNAVTVSNTGKAEIDPVEERKIEVLKELNWYYVIDNPSLATMQTGLAAVIEVIFDCLMDGAQKAERDHQAASRLPSYLKNLIQSSRSDMEGFDRVGRSTQRLHARAVADYVSNLTEGQAADLHQRLIGGTTKGSALEPWLRR
jgi:dGTPase